jgi:PQQ-dependent dehydrogenase (methanol/ethanol family)
MNRAVRCAIAVLTLGFACSATSSPAGRVDLKRVRAADGEHWLLNGGGARAEHYSPLTQIDAEHVGDLGLAWYAELGTADGIAATPIVVDGVIYLSGPFSIVYAVEAASGRLLWRHDPQVRLDTSRSTSWAARVNRGVAVWGGRVMVATADCRIVALEAADGTEAWQQQTCDPAKGYTITGAPYVGGDRVYIGNAGSESGEGNRGYVDAFDVASGRRLWRFYTVPGGGADDATSKAMQIAAKTWTGDKWKEYGAGGSVWDSMTWDAETDILYFGTAGAWPYVARDRSPQGGDNLFTESVLAVHAQTGEYAWHYQTVPEDNWEYNATMNIVLADLEIGGAKRRVLMIAPKNGFFYVLDRDTGELISAEAYATVNWATRIDLESGRPVIAPEAKYWEHEGERRYVWPNSWGAHSWPPMAFHPGTGLVYIPVIDLPDAVTYHRDVELDDSEVVIPPPTDGRAHAPGRLSAWDPKAQRERWSIARPLPFNGGVLATAGNLVFQGTATGRFEAYSADRGELLWSWAVQSPITAAPVSFRIGRTQYVVVGTGAGGGLRASYPDFSASADAHGPSRLLAFKLGGRASLPAPPAGTPRVPEPPPFEATAAQVAAGADLYRENCSGCHGKHAKAMTPASIPDLRYTSRERLAQWQAIVVGGALRERGMLPFELSAEDAENVRLYVLTQAQKAHSEAR